MKYKFSCGCEIDQLNDIIKEEDGLPSLQINYNKLRLDCPLAWKVFADGKTIGVFQLEKSLGQNWSKRLKPIDIEELAALVSLLRPGCLKAIVDGKSMTQHYVDRKHFLEDVVYIDNAIEEILKPTQGVLVFQEQSMAIATMIAGFDLQQADNLRKAIGKKKADLMAKVKGEFLDGIEKTGIVSKEKGDEIFAAIEKSNRYAFNKCVSRRTIITKEIVNNQNPEQLTVEQMFKIKNDIQYAKSINKLHMYKKFKFQGHYGYGFSKDKNNRVKLNIIKDIIYSGRRDIYKITTKDGYSIEVTSNHKFPTPNGEKTTNELKINDKLYMCGNYEKSNFKELNKFSNISINNRFQKVINKNKKEGFGYSKLNPAYTNGSYTDFMYNKKQLPKYCQSCNKKNIKLETHHINGDRTNSKLENLINLCSSCHKRIEYKNGRTKRFNKGYPVYLSEISNIEHIGIDDVYDIEMDGPNHNFVANGRIITSNSHAVQYSIVSYWSAWVKAHLPLHFYCASLELEEHDVEDLIYDAKANNIEIFTPDINSKNFNINNGGINFGLSSVKDVGKSNIVELLNTIIEYQQLKNKPIKDFSWFELLITILSDINKGVVNNIILCGAIRGYGLSRQKMLFEFEQIKKFTDRELKLIRENSNIKTLKEAIQFVIDNKIANAGRLPKILDIQSLVQTPPITFDDQPKWIMNKEKELLGVSLTYSSLDNCNTSMSNTSCRDFENFSGKIAKIVVEILSVRDYIIKNGANKGKKMAIIKVADRTGNLEAAIFSKAYEKCKNLIYEGNTILIEGNLADDGKFNVWSAKEL